MKRTQLFVKTLKNAPADEASNNAKLLIRAGFVHKEMAGVYAYSPLGLRVLTKIEQIVREEMNAAGGQEVRMTVLQPRELWEKTDRWSDEKVDNWFKSKLVTGTEVGIGLTHEEPVVDLLSSYVRSYKDLPLSIYQIGNKFRNEKRAKSGILRGREFVMKDLYSFARNQEEHEQIYERQAEAYMNVYRRVGLGEVTHRVVADGGIFTERFSDEFQTITPIGEDRLYHDTVSGVYYNEEVAPAACGGVMTNDTELRALENIDAPGVIGVQALAERFGVDVAHTTKTMLYQADNGQVYAVAIRGDYEINEIKLRKVIGVKRLQLLSIEKIKELTGAEVGYAGLLNLPESIQVIVDDSCRGRMNFEMGNNVTNQHAINVNWGRDLPEPARYFDVKVVKEGDKNPETGATYEVVRSVEVGNIFPLESKYTDALGVKYLDEQGKEQPIIGGCYGIGISRLMGVVAEHYADEKGLAWPTNIAPYYVYLVSIGEKGKAAADELYDQLQAAGVEVLYDDRDERPGVKFADAELMGIPYRLTVSDRGVEAGEHELVARASGEMEMVASEHIVERTARIL